VICRFSRRVRSRCGSTRTQASVSGWPAGTGTKCRPTRNRGSSTPRFQLILHAGRTLDTLAAMVSTVRCRVSREFTSASRQSAPSRAYDWNRPKMQGFWLRRTPVPGRLCSRDRQGPVTPADVAKNRKRSAHPADFMAKARNSGPAGGLFDRPCLWILFFWWPTHTGIKFPRKPRSRRAIFRPRPRAAGRCACLTAQAPSLPDPFPHAVGGRGKTNPLRLVRAGGEEMWRLVFIRTPCLARGPTAAVGTTGPRQFIFASSANGRRASMSAHRRA